jgi:hypothetical protein
MTHNDDECPDLETVAAFLDGRLRGQERVRVTAHLANCEDCYVVFSEAAQSTVKPIASNERRLDGLRSVLGLLRRPIVVWPSIGTVLGATAALWFVLARPAIRSSRLPSASPDAEGTATALAPRTGSTRASDGTAARTNESPGSETGGVPASETSVRLSLARPAIRSSPSSAANRHAESATIAAPGSGTDSTVRISDGTAARTNENPGSETVGVPASETSATLPREQSLELQAAVLRALITEVGSDRIIEPRLSVGFGYRPRGTAAQSTRSRRVTTQPSPADVRTCALEIEKNARSRGDQTLLRLTGDLCLVLGDVDRALAILESAVKQPAVDARTFSDLSAAYLVRAGQDGQLQDVVTALAMADRAIDMDPELAEARFNRAYAFELDSRPAEARQAWQDYLRIDSVSFWASKVRERLRNLP